MGCAHQWRADHVDRHAEREPLPFLGDTTYLQIIDEMGRVTVPVFERRADERGRPFGDRLEITPVGRSVLRGATDWLSLQPPVRWLGGVRIDPAQPAWRWDVTRHDAVRR